MVNLSVNGVPLFDPQPGGVAGAEPAASAAGGPALPVVDALRELSRWCESVFGFGLEHRALDLLAQLDRAARAGEAISAPALAAACGMAPQRARALLRQLAESGLVEPAGAARVGQAPGGPGAPAGPAPGAPGASSPGDQPASPEDGTWSPTPRLPLAMRQFADMADAAFVSRTALRDSLLWARVADPALLQRLQRVFDRFFDLGWLYLHNWGSTCQVTATLAARVLQAEGLRARVCTGSLHIRHGEREFRLGRSGTADPAQVDLHVFCLVQERVLLDFGLGNVRRRFLRGYPWAMAFDTRPEGAVAGVADDLRLGRAEWRTDWTVADAAQQLQAAQEVARRLLPLYDRGH